MKSAGAPRLGAAALLVVLATIHAPGGCREPAGPPSTVTSSDRFASLSEKVRFVEQYVTFRRSYHELEFQIIYRNNSGGLVPGPSDWDIRIVASVPKDEIFTWTENMVQTASPGIEWLKPVPGNLKQAGFTRWYQSGGRVVGIDAKRRIVAYWNRSG